MFFFLNEQHGHHLTEASRGWEIKIFDVEGRDKHVLLKYPEDFLFAKVLNYLVLIFRIWSYVYLMKVIPEMRSFY